MRLRRGVVIGIVLALLLIGFAVWLIRNAPRTSSSAIPPEQPASPVAAQNSARSRAATRVNAHNVMLRKGPNFRVYIPWLDGQFARTRKQVNPSLDDPESFFLDIHSGVIRANIGDIGYFLNASLTNSPLSNITLAAEGDKIKMTATLHKGISLPVQLLGEISATSDNRVRLRVTKLTALKVPLKGLLGIFKISLADFVKQKIDGVEISGNEILFDTFKLFPPPHIRGTLMAARVVSPDIEEDFGNAVEDLQRVVMWRNFLSLKGGVLDFGVLTMNKVDLMMIDISADPWFELDLVNYRAQLTAGYTRMTPEAGLQIFMPDLRDVKLTSEPADTNIEWFKNRNIPPPRQIMKGLR